MSLLNGLFPIATDYEGRTIPYAYLYSYDVGTNTPKDTYSDSALTIPNANPLRSDGSGWFENLYLGAGGYKLVLRDSSGVVIRTQDDYYQSLDGTDLANINAAIDAVAQQSTNSGAVYTDSGAADSYVLTMASSADAPTAYSNNMFITFKPENANTGASVVNVETIGSRILYDEDGNDLAAGFLDTTSYFTFIYTSSNFRFFSKGGLVDAGYIATNAVTTSKIMDKNVTLGKIADSTANNLLGYNSSGVATSVANPLRLLTSGIITSTASIPFVLSTLDTSQSINNSYLIRLIGFQPATDDVELRMVISSDAGATYLAGTGYYSGIAGAPSAGAMQSLAIAGGAYFPILGNSAVTGSLSNAANETASIDIFLYNFNTGTSLFPAFWINGCFWAAAANTYQPMSGGGSNSAAAADYDAVRLQWEGAGNFASVGKYYIYKIINEA